MKTLTFFNNKGGVGKTSLAYHLAWMFAECNHKVVVVDLDPQANLTSAFLDEDQVERLWEPSATGTILNCVRPLLDRLGDLEAPRLFKVNPRIALVPGDLGLSLFEDRLAETWGKCLDDNASTAADAFRVTTAFYRIMRLAAREVDAEIVLVDVGPNLGAINRAALVATDRVVVPLAADLFSLHGLRNLGPTLRTWRVGWKKRRENASHTGLPNHDLPEGEMLPSGYVVMQPSVRERYPVKAYRRWVERIPDVYQSEILDQNISSRSTSHELATLKNYRSLAPLAQDARKPMFLLKPSDGAIGGHASAVSDCYADFRALADRIAKASGFKL